MRLFPPALLTLAAITLAAAAHASTVGSDSAGNYGGTWTNGSNGGTGFGVWDLSSNNNNGSSLFAGYFLGDSTQGAGNINTGGLAFAMYANPSGAFANASRAFAGGTLSTGQTFSLNLSVNFRNGGKGINLNNSGGQVFNFNTGNDQYTYKVGASGTTVDTGFTYYSDSVFSLAYTQLTATTSQVVLSRTSATGGTAASNSVTVPITASDLSSFTLYNSNTDNGNAANNLYFNNLSVVPEPSVCVLAALSGTALVALRRRRR